MPASAVRSSTAIMARRRASDCDQFALPTAGPPRFHKIEQHGKRTDSIVKNMLLHSREGSGERRPVSAALLPNSLQHDGLRSATAENVGSQFLSLRHSTRADILRATALGHKNPAAAALR
jgi:hypothetical protein